MLPLGAKAPKFKLFDTLSKQTKSYEVLKGAKRNYGNVHMQSLSLRFAHARRPSSGRE